MKWNKQKLTEIWLLSVEVHVGSIISLLHWPEDENGSFGAKNLLVYFILDECWELEASWEAKETSVTISSSTRTILLFILQISWTTCHERMFIYFYFLPCITRMLHASDACLSFLILCILSSLLYHTCSTCFKHVLYACFTLYIP